MNVRQLIERLQALPPEAQTQRVKIQTGECQCCASEEVDYIGHDSDMQYESHLYEDRDGHYVLLS